MFTVAQRVRIRDGLVRAASSDERITAAAFVGSAAINREDQWSDIDLALRIHPDLEPEPVAQHWTEHIYADHDAVHHLDVWAGLALYRPPPVEHPPDRPLVLAVAGLWRVWPDVSPPVRGDKRCSGCPDVAPAVDRSTGRYGLAVCAAHQVEPRARSSMASGPHARRPP